ncbi:MAG TPA: alpha/beta fold hydrolase [Terriglobales bacterium]|nr:alpha/beta fold hydrolase [Terriglobales bacterium]
MHRQFRVSARSCVMFLALTATACLAQPPAKPPAFPVQDGDYIARNFHFSSGETLPELRLHYATLGKAERDVHGRVTNAVLILHGTGGTGRQFLLPQFAGVLFGPGQLLDITRYFIILPDNIGHGHSSKPSDGLHAHFPQYDYGDMVRAQHELLEQGLRVNHLRLVMGTSMGCMHSWMWAETYADFVDAAMPLACLPVQIAGRNRIWRKMIMDGIHNDPEWKNGDYTTEPRAGIEIAADFLLIAGSAPLRMQNDMPTRDDADKNLHDFMQRVTAQLDANDLWYAFNASRDYDPSPSLEKITAPVMFVNSADDFINPPDLGIAERQIKRVRKGRFVLIPASEQTHGHGTHTWAAFWQQYLKELLDESRR